MVTSSVTMVTSSVTRVTPIRTKGVDPVSGSEDSYTAFKTTSTLTIAAATANDAGEYKCKADFGGAEVESAAATVAVYGTSCVKEDFTNYF